VPHSHIIPGISLIFAGIRGGSWAAAPQTITGNNGANLNKSFI
jgi:hypothetical protein